MNVNAVHFLDFPFPICSIFPFAECSIFHTSHFPYVPFSIFPIFPNVIFSMLPISQTVCSIFHISLSQVSSSALLSAVNTVAIPPRRVEPATARKVILWPMTVAHVWVSVGENVFQTMSIIIQFYCGVVTLTRA